jgi:hypothetical protein
MGSAIYCMAFVIFLHTEVHSLFLEIRSCSLSLSVAFMLKKIKLYLPYMFVNY